MKKKIAFLTTEHFHHDDRIYYKMGKTLSKYFEVAVISTIEDMSDAKSEEILLKGFNGAKLNRKELISSILAVLNAYEPDIIICEENFPVYASFLYNKNKIIKAKILLDVTEWYPEKVISKMHGVKNKMHAFLKHWFINIITSNLVDGIIAGEKSKLTRYKIIAPFNKKIVIGYYPPLQYFPYYPPSYDGSKLVFYYSGILSKSRGLYNFFLFIKNFSDLHPDIYLKIILAGKFEDADSEINFRNVIANLKKIEFKIIGWSEYDNLSEAMKEADICFDLREINFIYDNSLPIKIFEYMACGKPVVFSDIKAIRIFNNLKEYVTLVKPNDAEQITRIISELILDPSKLKEISVKSRRVIEDKYNWKVIEKDLITFVMNF